MDKNEVRKFFKISEDPGHLLRKGCGVVGSSGRVPGAMFCICCILNTWYFIISLLMYTTYRLYACGII